MTAPITAREFAAELVNATDGGEDIPRGILLRECRTHGFNFEECGDCGRVESQHAPYCPSTAGGAA